ncbi:MAG: response regulator [Anaerolineaceae bacterium]|nr:response regulator [Anaerolineaceae bacterium]
MNKILIIEDEDAIRTNFGEILEFQGFYPMGAENGAIGVEMAKQYLPDLIVCDITMPVLDGYGVLLQLRSDPVTANIPFIFMTARADRPFVRHGMELGADDYLTKPCSGAELVAAVNARLDRKEMAKKEYSSQMAELRTSLATALPNALHAPLIGVLGHADRLRSDVTEFSPQQIVEMAQQIYKSGHVLQRQVENYLFYAQLEILSTEPERIQALRNEVTENPADVVAKAAQEKAALWNREQDLEIRVNDTPIRIAADQLAKIAEELIDNAFKFSIPGTPVRVTMDAGEDTLALFISDEGQGIANEEIRNIGAYMQFRRKLHEPQGTGLGLIIAKRLVELHNATMTISSIPEQETTICVEFPL